MSDLAKRLRAIFDQRAKERKAFLEGPQAPRYDDVYWAGVAASEGRPMSDSEDYGGRSSTMFDRDAATSRNEALSQRDAYAATATGYKTRWDKLKLWLKDKPYGGGVLAKMRDLEREGS